MIEPVVTKYRGKLRFAYEPGILIEVGNPSTFRGGPVVEAKITLASKLQPEGSGRVYFGTIGLTSKSNVTETVRRCRDRVPEFPWQNIIDDMCWRAVEKLRQPPPVQKLGKYRPDPKAPMYQLYPILPMGEAITLYGLGGTGKSLIAIMFAVLIENGIDAFGFNVSMGKCLYIDWESTSRTTEQRIWAVKQGLIEDTILVDTEHELAYLRAVKPLNEWGDYLLALVEDEAYTVVVIDSATMALGGRFNDAEAVTPLFQALRALGTSIIIVDHHGKAEGASEKGPIGTVVKGNLSRSVWELKQVEHESELRVGFYHRKVNEGHKQRPFGISIKIENGPDKRMEKATFQRISMDDEEELVEGLSTREQIDHALRQGEMSLKDIYDLVPAANQSTVRSVLRRHFVETNRGVWGRRAPEPQRDDRQQTMSGLGGGSD